MFHFLPRIPPTVIVNSFGLAKSLRNIHLFGKFLTFDHHFGRYGEGKSAGQLGITFVALTAHDRVEIAGSASIRRDHSLMANGGLGEVLECHLVERLNHIHLRSTSFIL